jgi:hypothetical protein
MTKATKHLTLTVMLTTFIALSGCASSGEPCLFFGTYKTTEIQWVKKKFSLESKNAAVNQCFNNLVAEICKEYPDQADAQQACRLNLRPEISQCMYDKGFEQEQVEVTKCSPMRLF